jgi:hypothetical protein
LTIRAVTLDPLSRPTSGEVLTPIVIEMAGSSTVISGSGRGSSRSASVSPIMMSPMPATAMMSPADAAAAGTRSSASVRNNSLIFTRTMDPSRRHQATCWPRVICPEYTRHSAIRPR